MQVVHLLMEITATCLCYHCYYNPVAPNHLKAETDKQCDDCTRALCDTCMIYVHVYYYVWLYTVHGGLWSTMCTCTLCTILDMLLYGLVCVCVCLCENVSHDKAGPYPGGQNTHDQSIIITNICTHTLTQQNMLVGGQHAQRWVTRMAAQASLIFNAFTGFK